MELIQVESPARTSVTGQQNHAFIADDLNENRVEKGDSASQAENHDNTEDKSTGQDVNMIAKYILRSRKAISRSYSANPKVIATVLYSSLFICYNIYLAIAITHTVRNNIPVDWCDGLGFLLILTAIMYWTIFYYWILRKKYGKELYYACVKPVKTTWRNVFSKRFVKFGTGFGIFAAIVAFVVIDAWSSPERIVSFAGGLILLLCLFLFSKHPGHVKWEQVSSGLAIQFVFGLLVLRWDGGRRFLECVGKKVTSFLMFGREGSSFVYNFAASGKLQILGSEVPELVNTEIIIPTTFAFTSLSTIFFFGFVVSVLYHLGIMQRIVEKMGWLLQCVVGTSAAESMNASANIFLGLSEAPLLIKPFLNDLTLSELHAVMTGGFATIAGTVMAAYISFGVAAESLLSASVMSAPCALALSKLIYPETERSNTNVHQIKHVETKSTGNVIDAASKGAVDAITLVTSIIANIIAFVSFIAFANAVMAYFGRLIGLPWMTLQWVLGKLFIPVALLIGVDPSEAEKVGVLLGIKTVVNEFVAYGELKKMICASELSHRSRRLAEYALCGFANFGSIGIQFGCLGGMVPERRLDLSKVVITAMVTGAVVNLINACIAGTLLNFAADADNSTIQGC